MKTYLYSLLLVTTNNLKQRTSKSSLLIMD